MWLFQKLQAFDKEITADSHSKTTSNGWNKSNKVRAPQADQIEDPCSNSRDADVFSGKYINDLSRFSSNRFSRYVSFPPLFYSELHPAHIHLASDPLASFLVLFYLTLTLSLFRSISVVLICVKDTLMSFPRQVRSAFGKVLHFSSSTIKSRVFHSWNNFSEHVPWQKYIC